MWQYRRCIIISILICLCFVCIPIKLTLDKERNEYYYSKFIEFIEKYDKSYRNNSDEYQRRFKNFLNSIVIIEKLNSIRMDNDSAEFGITKYSDLSEEEFLLSVLHLNLSSSSSSPSGAIISNDDLLTQILFTKKLSQNQTENNIHIVKRNILNYQDLPQEIDWRNRNAVSSIRSQGICGACWAHSVIATIESILAIKYNQSTINLSTQQMIDCAKNNNYGCKGGDTCNLLQWLQSNSVKIETEHTYNSLPSSMHPQITKCKINENVQNMITIKTTIHNFTCNSYIDREEEILYYLAYNGPVAVVVNALLWQHYLNGIITFHCDGNPIFINHAVQIIGYNLKANIPYSIVRNSWGEEFGNDGYLRIAIGNNVCGIANQVAMIEVD